MAQGKLGHSLLTFGGNFTSARVGTYAYVCLRDRLTSHSLEAWRHRRALRTIERQNNLAYFSGQKCLSTDCPEENDSVPDFIGMTKVRIPHNLYRNYPRKSCSEGVDSHQLKRFPFYHKRLSQKTGGAFSQARKINGMHFLSEKKSSIEPQKQRRNKRNYWESSKWDEKNIYNENWQVFGSSPIMIMEL